MLTKGLSGFRKLYDKTEEKRNLIQGNLVNTHWLHLSATKLLRQDSQSSRGASSTYPTVAYETNGEIPILNVNYNFTFNARLLSSAQPWVNGQFSAANDIRLEYGTSEIYSPTLYPA